jgi:ribosomal protein S18 acetylase RimI-like enzyme
MTSIELETRQLETTRVATRLTLRPYRGEPDHEAMADAVNAHRIARGMSERATPASIRASYRHLTNCDPQRDVAILEAAGRTVGYSRVYWEDRNSGERCFELIENHDPLFVGRQDLEAVLAWQERRVAATLAGMTDVAGRPVIMASYTLGGDPDWEAALLASGFRLARRHAEMQRRDLADIADIPLPNGLEIRPVDPTDEALIRRVFEVDAEVFRDHWGGVDASEAAFARFREEPSFDPRLWRVAWDGDEIAGQILNWIDPPEPDGGRRGWTESIAVRRPWRRRGLARALLAASLRAVRGAGATVATLGVDQENANQPLTLYESLGFRVTAEELEFHKPIRMGTAR